MNPAGDGGMRGGFSHPGRGNFNQGPSQYQDRRFPPNQDFDNVPRGGFNNSSRGGFNNRSRGGFNDGSRGNFSNAGRGGFDNMSRGGFNNSSRGNFNNAGRGGFDNSSRDGFNSMSREDFDNSSRGGFNKSSRGNFNNLGRGGFDNSSRGGRGGFDNSSRGGFDNSSRGNFNNPGRGGFENRSRGGRGGFDNSFDGSSRGNFNNPGRGGGPDINSRGGFNDSLRGNFNDAGRGGFDRSRGNFNNSGRGGFDHSSSKNANSSSGEFDRSSVGIFSGPNQSEGFRGRGNEFASRGYGQQRGRNPSAEGRRPPFFEHNETLTSSQQSSDFIHQFPIKTEDFGGGQVSEQSKSRVSRFGPTLDQPPVKDEPQESPATKRMKLETNKYKHQNREESHQQVHTKQDPWSNQHQLQFRQQQNQMTAYDEPEFDDSFVVLDWYNSDLELEINTNDFCSARANSKVGFAYIWAGARATHGATMGKVCFEVSIDGNADTSHLEEAETNPHLLRVGWSVNDASLQLGEEPFSYGFGGTGKCSTRRKFTDYGTRFGVGDVIGCYLDLTVNPVKILYTINGRNFGIAFEIPRPELNGRALFPHIFTKNQHFTVNFGQMPEPMRPLIPGFVPIGQLEVSEGLVRGTLGPKTKNECEVLMMVGLPGAGKTFWAEEWKKRHPDKNYNILGTNVYLDRMKVMNLARWKNYHGRWDALINSCTECFDQILKVASKRRRNYILDQTNVYPTARGRKLADFNGFNLKAIAVVPSNDEYIRRSQIRAQEEGKAVPEDAVLQMKANFVLPGIEEPFSEVLYTDLPPQEATMIVQMYNAEAASRGKIMNGGVKNFIRQDEKKKAAMGIIGAIGTLLKEPVGNASMWSQTATAPPPPAASNWEHPSSSGTQPPNQFKSEASNIRRQDQSCDNFFDSRRQDSGPWQGRGGGTGNNFNRNSQNLSEPNRPYWETPNEAPTPANQPEFLPRDSRFLGSERQNNSQMPSQSGQPNMCGNTAENNQRAQQLMHNWPSSYHSHSNPSSSISPSSSFPASAQANRFGTNEPVEDWNRLPLPNQGVRPGNNWSGRGHGFSQSASSDRFRQDGGGTKRPYSADGESFVHTGVGDETKWAPNQPAVPRPTTSESATPDYEALTQYLNFYQREMSAIQRRGAN